MSCGLTDRASWGEEGGEEERVDLEEGRWSHSLGPGVVSLQVNAHTLVLQ